MELTWTAELFFRQDPGYPPPQLYSILREERIAEPASGKWHMGDTCQLRSIH